jgi:signal transduction histidine kinase
MKHNISELIDLPELQDLMTALYRATGINHALLDLQGKILTEAGGESCCIAFHRACPASRQNCHISDRSIFSRLAGQDYVGYECRNGLFDYATPVRIDGEHVATMFTGQMLHAEPDLAHFRRQAREFGFDETAYMAAIAQVKIVPRERVADIMAFLVGLAQMLARNGAVRLERLSRFEQERKRIAREMYDEVGQLLTVQAMNVTMLDLRFGGDNPELRQKTGEMATLVEKTNHAVRHLATSLRPAVLDLGLLPALEWLVADFNRRGPTTRYRIDAPDGDIALDDTIATELFRIVQESLTNVQRHAGARSAVIVLRLAEARLQLEVKDDGCGFDAAAIHNGPGFGLHSMQTRSRALGDELRIDSSPDAGTRIALDLHLFQSEASK